MEPAEKKFKPIHGVLIVAMLALTVVMYMFKDRILPDLNEPYREELSTHIKTDATVISKEAERGRRGSDITVTVQFRDEEEVLRTAKIYDNRLQTVSSGDVLTIYYNPENPKEARSEAGYNEIMKIN